MTALYRPPTPVWVSLPQDEDDEPARGIVDGDSYIAELTNGEQVWVVFSRGGGFELCDDEGNAVDDQRNPLDNVSKVLIRGYAPGFGPSCPKAGAAPELHLIVIQPSESMIVSRPLLDRVIAEAMRTARQILVAQKFHAHALIADTEPYFSAERDTRFQDSI